MAFCENISTELTVGYRPKHHNFLINRKIREQTPPPSLLFAKILPTRRTQTNARTSASSPQGRASEYGGQSTHTPRKTPADRSPSPWLQINLAGVLEDTVARLLGPVRHRKEATATLAFLGAGCIPYRGRPYPPGTDCRGPFKGSPANNGR